MSDIVIIRDENDPDWGTEHPENDKYNSVISAHIEARSMYGDEGNGYSMAIMVEVLEREGWVFRP